MNKSIPAALIFVVVLALTLCAQTDLRRTLQRAGGSVFYGLDGELISAKATFSPPTSPIPVVAGAPFTAVEIGERVQIHADGNRITRPISNSRIYRDSEGRVRTDQSPFLVQPTGKNASGLPIVPEIYDPVVGYQYLLDTANQVAHRFSIPEFPDSILNRNPYLESDLPGAEPLGTREIEGLLVEGTRRTMTIPPGLMGNEKSIINTTETWYSADLQLKVLSRTNSSDSSENISGFVNIDLVEPDPELFKVPKGYTIVDETGPFIMTFGPSGR